MYKILICMLFSLLISFYTKGEEKYAIDSTRIDTGFVQKKHVGSEFYKVYKDDSDFDYDRNIEQQSDTLWSRLIRNFWRWLFRQVGKANNYYGSLNIVFKLLFWVLLVGILIFAISKLNINRLFYSAKEEISQTYTLGDLEEDIEDIDAAISDEVRKKNYRKAIRYQFIALLRHLNKNKIIILSDEKTNYDYITETRKSYLSSDVFVRLVTIYNAVWYGHFDIDKTDYASLSKEFINFKTSVNEKK